jgi:hypothetical protein
MTTAAIDTLNLKELRQFMLLDQRIIRAQRKVIRLQKEAIAAHADNVNILKQRVELTRTLDKLRKGWRGV